MVCCSGEYITAGMSEMADKIIALGFPIEKQDDGTFFLETKKFLVARLRLAWNEDGELVEK